MVLVGNRTGVRLRNNDGKFNVDINNEVKIVSATSSRIVDHIALIKLIIIQVCYMSFERLSRLMSYFFSFGISYW